MYVSVCTNVPLLVSDHESGRRTIEPSSVLTRCHRPLPGYPAFLFVFVRFYDHPRLEYGYRRSKYRQWTSLSRLLGPDFTILFDVDVLGGLEGVDVVIRVLDAVTLLVWRTDKRNKRNKRKDVSLT